MLYPALRYVDHWLHAVDDHSLHSPFLFKLYREVIRPANDIQTPHSVKQRLHSLKQDSRTIVRTDLGAGSKAHGSEVSVGTLARHSTSSTAIQQLIYRLVLSEKPAKVLELGTSLGLTTGLMALANPQAEIHTIEGCGATAAIAQETWEMLGLKSIRPYTGNIDELLPAILDGMGSIDFAYLDANHRYAPTVHYFRLLLHYLHEDSVIIIGDISWSREMRRAWKEICKHEQVTASIDMYEAGLLFFKPMAHKQHYAMRMTSS